MNFKTTRILPKRKEPVLFEGGAFGPEGDFFFANVLARPGQPKIIKLDPLWVTVVVGGQDGGSAG